ncbi:MAG: hypothetical protein ABI120_13385 [Gemmatimonadaceae bacterium]
MSGHQTESSDTGAAFMGLIGGALFIGAILYGIVILTNNKFNAEKHEGGAAEQKAAVTSVIGHQVA